MRASVTSFTRKFISAFFAATLALSLVPAAAFAVEGDGEAADAVCAETASDESSGNKGDSGSGTGSDADVDSSAGADDDPASDSSTGMGSPSLDEEEGAQGDAQASDDGSAAAAVPATGVINQTMPLEVVAQQESTRSYFLAQTLESTKTVPIVSANLPLDKGPQAGADGGTTVGSEDKVTDGDPSVSTEGDDGSEPEGGDDSDESDSGTSDDASAVTPGVSAESTVVGSFEYRGITYAVEPGGESVAVVAADYAKLPSEFVEAQTIVLPSMVTSDGTDYYTVSRIADYAFSGINGSVAVAAREGQVGVAPESSENGEATDGVIAESAERDDAASDAVEDAEIGITAITIPASIVEMGDDAFAGCDTLQYLIVSEDNPSYSQYDGVLYDADQTNLLLIPEGRLGAVRIAPSATSVNPEVFSHCPSVDTLVVDPDSAASQLLAENAESYKNASGETVAVLESGAPEAVDLPVLYEPDYDAIAAELEPTAAALSPEEAAVLLERVSSGAVGAGYITLYATPNSQRWWTIEQVTTKSNYGQDLVNEDGPYANMMRITFDSSGKAVLRFGAGTATDWGYGWTLLSGYPVTESDPRRLGNSKYKMLDFWGLHDGNGHGAIVRDGVRKDYEVYTDAARTAVVARQYNSGTNANLTFWLPRDYIELQLFGASDTGSGTWTNASGSTVSTDFLSSTVEANGTNSYSGFTLPKAVDAAPSAEGKNRVFVGWNTDKAATVESSTGWWYRYDGRYESDWEDTAYGMVNLYAIYSDGYRIGMDHAGGTSTESDFYAYDDNMPLKGQLTVPTRANYAFEGYYELREDGSRNFWYGADGRLIAPVDGSSYGGYPLTGDVTLYAQWARNDVRLDANNGSGESISDTIGRVVWDADAPALPSDIASRIEAHNPDPDHYVFAGFYTDPVGGSCYYDADLNPVSTFSDDVDTLYAHWSDTRDIHNHVHCSQGIQFDEDGYAYGWTCPDYATYVAKVYVSGVASETYQQFWPGVPEEYQASISGKVSVDAVKAGEYVLLAGGRDTAAGWLPTEGNGSRWDTYGGAWWEITAKPGESTGTLRVHCDGGMKIQNLGFTLTNASQRKAWQQDGVYSLVHDIVADHMDIDNMEVVFAGDNRLGGDLGPRTITFVGNTFPPSCSSANWGLWGNYRLYAYSDNFTFRKHANLSSFEASLGYSLSLASLPEGFTFKGASSLVNVAYLLEDSMSLGSMPDGFDLPAALSRWHNGFSLDDFVRTESNMGIINNWRTLANVGGGIVYYNCAYDVPSLANSYAGQGGNCYAMEMQKGASVTWDARGGSFSPAYTPFDCSRSYPLSETVRFPTGYGSAAGFTQTSQAVIPHRAKMDGTSYDDAFLGWYKKVPMKGTASDGTDMSTVEANGRTWAENRYLYDYEFVWDGRSDEPVTVDSTDESIVYYALYESDADEIESTIDFKMNDGTDDAFKTVEGQVYGQPMTEVSVGKPVFGNYVFDGFWTDPVGGTQYYDAEGDALEGAAWREPETSATLYAHWKYRIVFDGNVHNFTDSNGETVEAVLDWSDVPASGEGFEKVVPEGEGADPCIEALFGAAVPLPKATREGYADTRGWGLAAGTDGRAGWVVRVVDDIYSAKEGELGALSKAALADATYLRNGAAAESYAVAPAADHALILYASWTWDESVPDDAKPSPSGGKTVFADGTVVLRAVYETEDGLVYSSSDWASDMPLSNVEYDSPIPAGSLPASAPSFGSATRDGESAYERLVFKGFYTRPNVPEPAGGGFEGACLVVPGEEGGPALSSTDAPLRLLPDENGRIVLYALWALPVTSVVFHANVEGLEAPLGYKEAVEEHADDLVADDDGVYVVSAETMKEAPEIAFDVPVNGAYAFNGWWTHPFSEDPSVSTRYYDEDNGRATVPGEDGAEEPILWAPYADTVLYAHWTCTVLFDANPTGPSAGSASILHKGAGMPGSAGLPEGADYQTDAYGNRYFYRNLAGGDDNAADDMEIVSVRALLGAPLKLPYAVARTTASGAPSGYDDTCQWRTVPAADEGHPIVRADEDGFTLAPAPGSERGKPDIAPGPDGTVVLYADWTGKAHEFVVTLSAGTGAMDASEDVWTDEVLTGVTYDATLREADVTGVGVPYRHGYTFAGFFTQESGGEAYIDGTGAPVTGKPWAETAQTDADGMRHVTLYARWAQDSYKVVYDLSLPDASDPDNLAIEALTPGMQPINGSAAFMLDPWHYNSTYAHDGGAFKVAEKDFVDAAGLFFRNGYDFAGWYWVDDTVKNAEGEPAPVPTMVCGADGSTRGAFTPSLAWQQAHKGSLDADGIAQPGEVKLYAKWEPKVYALVFETAYQENADRQGVFPDETMAGMTVPNAVSSRGGVFYYEVAYEADLTPFFEGAGDAAVPTVPTDEPYAFEGWRVKDGVGANSALSLVGEDGIASETALSGRFMPAYPLSKRAVGDGAAPATIVYTARWKAPGKVKLHLSAGDPERGEFVMANLDKIDPALVESKSKSELNLHEVEYRMAFDLMSTQSSYRPRQNPGYTLAGFVRTDADGNLLASDGRTPLGHGAYTDDGELRSDIPLTSRLEKLTEETWVMAVYSRNKMVVELDMSAVPQHEGYGGYAFYSSVGDGYEEGWLIDSVAHGSTVYAYDVTSPSFRLPDDVVVPGYVFCGWERVSPADAGAIPDVFVPADIAGNPNLARQTFRPTFEEKAYEVRFLPNYASGHGTGEPRTAKVDFDGRIVEPGDFAGTEGFAVGETLPMASVPEPDASATDGAHTGSDAADEHYHSYPFSIWRIGSPYDTQVDLQERLANATVSGSEWNGWIARFASATPGERAKTETLSVYAIWGSTLSAVLPLRASLAIDADTGAVALPDKAYSAYGLGLIGDEKLEVAALRYESVGADGEVGDNALKVDAVAGENPIRLTLFTNVGTKPSMGQPSVDGDGFVRGDYGASAGDRLEIDLSASGATYSGSELAAFGFRPFSVAENRLTMYFGLDLDGVRIDSVRALKAKLPDPSGEQAEGGWTKESVPVARLCFTVQVAHS